MAKSASLIKNRYKKCSDQTRWPSLSYIILPSGGFELWSSPHFTPLNGVLYRCVILSVNEMVAACVSHKGKISSLLVGRWGLVASCKVYLYAALLTITKQQRASFYQTAADRAHFLFLVINWKLIEFIMPAVYHIGRQDIDSIGELSLWPNKLPVRAHLSIQKNMICLGKTRVGFLELCICRFFTAKREKWNFFIYIVNGV